MFHPDNKGWQRALTVSIFVALGVSLAYFIGHRAERDMAILAAFSLGVVICWLIIFVSVKWK